MKHFVVTKPMHWEPGSRPAMMLSGGVPVSMVKLYGGQIIPLTGHFLITDRAPPAKHLIIDGIICYAEWFVEAEPVTVKRVDITS